MLVRGLIKTATKMTNKAQADEYLFIYSVFNGIYIPFKIQVSQNWFPSHEWSFSWTIMMSSSNIGISIASFLLPRFVHEINDVYILFYVNIACAVAITIIVLLCVTKSEPTHPPSERMATSMSRQISYFKSIKLALKQRDLMIHILQEAIFEGITYSILMILQDILTSSGHSRIFVGNLMSITAILSVVSIISLSTLVHRVRNTILACKIAVFLRTALIIPFFLAILWPTPGWIVLTVTLISNLSRSWASPNLSNMTAHLASGVIPEATIAGVSVTVTILFMSISQMIFVQLSKTTPHGDHDYTHSMIFATVICLFDAFVYIFFFKGESSKREEDMESPPIATRVHASLNTAECDIET